MFLLHVDVLGEDEEDYPTAPVWERRKLFGKQQQHKQGDHVIRLASFRSQRRLLHKRIMKYETY